MPEDVSSIPLIYIILTFLYMSSFQFSVDICGFVFTVRSYVFIYSHAKSEKKCTLYVMGTISGVVGGWTPWMIGPPLSVRVEVGFRGGV